MFSFGGPGPDPGLQEISGTQTILFTQYVKVILPLDGFVFWVRADLLSQSALIGASAYNSRALYNAPLKVKSPATTFLAQGSLHVAATKKQEETETYGVNKVIFTAVDSLDQEFNAIDDAHILIGEWRHLRFAFSDRQNFYQNAGLYHYLGDAIYPYMESQIIDEPAALNTNALIVSNSLPLWLGLNNNAPFYGFGNTIPLYPSYLVQPNIRPPFGSVHIYPDSTVSLTSAPEIGFRSSHHQLMKERVRIVMYGVANDYAMTFVDAVNQYSADYNYFGIMGMPSAMRDEKISQNELGIIAQKKSIEFEVSYYQNSVRDIARQIIGQAIPTFITVPAFSSGSSQIISQPNGQQEGWGPGSELLFSN
jgi:hypothetical protein